MSLDLSGQNARITSSYIQIHVQGDHPLLKLGNALPWEFLMSLVVEDLKATTAKGFWWLGRKIKVREHLAAYFLQKLYDLTDRETEYGIKDNAAYQLFCGLGIALGWHTLDHTKIEEFRSRLTPETQRILANELAKVAVTLGFGDPSETDIDSTVQEANITYPSDASLMTKLAGLGKKVIDFLSKKTRGFLPKGPGIDMKAVKDKAREYFFLPKNTAIEKRRDVFKKLHRFVKQQMRPIINATSAMDAQRLSRLPWNIRRALEQISEDGWRYLPGVSHFIRKHTIKAGKILSFHAKQVACIKKGKVGKDKEFGRVFQLARYQGQFPFRLGVDFGENGRQEFLDPDDRRTCNTIWRRNAQVGERGQRLLERQKSQRINEARHRGSWASAAWKNQRQPRGADQRRLGQAQGPPSWHRAIDRSHKARRATRAKQNELRCSNNGCGVRVCRRAQSQAIDKTPSRKDAQKYSIRSIQQTNSEAARRDPSSQAPQDSRWR